MRVALNEAILKLQGFVLCCAVSMYACAIFICVARNSMEYCREKCCGSERNI